MSNDPNLFAYIALLGWPVVALYLYSRLPVGQATLWTILGGFLLLPVGTQIKFPMVPAFDKDSIPSLAAMIGCALYARLPKIFRRFGLAEVLILLILVSPFITSMFNTDPYQASPTVIKPGVGAYDAGSASISAFIFILPFFLGRQFLRNAENNFDILRGLVLAGLAYSLPMLFEIRISPQLNNWVYGYFPGGAAFFIQQIRDNGFRPVVFLGHGLATAFFAMTTTVAAAALWRTRTRIFAFSSGGITAYLGFVLLLCKSMGSIVYGAVLLPLVRWASPRWQLRVATVLVIIAMGYPLLRVADLVPTSAILEMASAVSTERAASLETRFYQEGQLLEHAWERPWFGWGRYGRNLIYNGWLGADSSITDGYWILTLGEFGLVGFAATFGLLGLAVFRAAAALKYAQAIREQVYLGALALIVAINMVDLLPNSSISSCTWLFAGALLGRAEAMHAVSRQRTLLENWNSPSMLSQKKRSRNDWATPRAG